jgi:TRAP-type mannitol/chloroaromatic compound transport system substrate-binding protein
MENVMTQYNIIKYRKNMDENMVDNIKSFSKPIYDSWMKAYKKPLTSKQKQDKNDKEIIDWMKQFKHPTKLFI